MAWGLLLAGGRSSRMGTDKIAMRRAGGSLAQWATSALLEVADRVVAASPERPEVDDPRVGFVLEDPPFGGPVAGIAAALSGLPALADDADDVYLLAGDLADPQAVVEALRAAEPGPDGVVLVDDEGWPQYLAGRYRLGSLRRVVSGLADTRSQAVHRVFRPLDVARVPAGRAVTRDVDTPEQARAAGLSAPDVT